MTPSKSFSLGAVLVAALSSSVGLAQDSFDQQTMPAKPPAAQNSINLSPIPPIFGTFAVEYERALSDGMSVFVSPGLLLGGADVSINNQPSVRTSFIGGTANAGVRFFLGNSTPLQGFFLAPQLHGSYRQDAGLTTVPFNDLSFGLGLMAGYSIVVNNIFYVSAGIGGAGTYSQRSENNPFNVLFGRSGFGFLPLFRGNIGIAF